MRKLIALLVFSIVGLVAAPGRGGGSGGFGRSSGSGFSRGGSGNFGGSRVGSSGFNGSRGGYGGGYSNGNRGAYGSYGRGGYGYGRGGYGYGGYRGGFGYGYGGYRGYGYGGYGFGYGLGLGFGYGFGYPYYGYGYGYGSGYGYGGSYGGYYPDYGYTAYDSAPAYSQPGPQQQTPSVVNQYFSTPATTRATTQIPARERQDPPPGRDAQGRLGTLIAFPDGSVQIALAYWTEGGTLHYVTRDKAQKQIAMSSIDRILTDQLNRERGVEFRP